MMPEVMPEAIEHDRPLMHSWRMARLRRLGIPEPLAEANAHRLDGIRSPGLYGAAALLCSPFASSADPTPAGGGTAGDQRHELA